MEQKLVGFLGRRLAVVTGHRHRNLFGNQAAPHRPQAPEQALGNDHRVGVLALGEGDGDRGTANDAAGRTFLQVPDPVVGGPRTDNDTGHVLDVDGPAIAGGNQKQSDVGDSPQGLAGEHRN